MTASPPLQPRRLLPALLRYADEGAPTAARTHAQRYVQFCMQRLQSSDPAVHQLAVSFLIAALPALKGLVQCADLLESSSGSLIHAFASSMG